MSEDISKLKERHLKHFKNNSVILNIISSFDDEKYNWKKVITKCLNDNSMDDAYFIFNEYINYFKNTNNEYKKCFF